MFFEFPQRLLRQITPILLLIGFAIASQSVVAEMTFPKLTGRVVDNANLLSPQVESRISAQLQQLEEQTQHQFVVVTLKSLQGYEIEEYGYQLGRHWKIGGKEKDDGILLIVAPNERKVRIEVGYGLEGTITDAMSANIVHGVILPQLRRSDFEGGILLGTDALFEALDGKYTMKNVSKGRKQEPGSNLVSLFFIILVVIFSLFGGGGRRGRYGRRGLYAGLGAGLLGGGLSRGGGGFGGGGFSGGGGGFGGGGASGGW